MPVWLLTAAAILSILAFAHTVSYEFVFDDDVQVLRNPWIRDWAQIGKIFTTDVWRFRSDTVSNFYRPLHLLLYMGAFGLFGLAPSGFHLLNVLIHAACVLLVGLIAWRLTSDRWVSLAASLLFALNPVHCESVAWVAGVTDPLCALFYFSALFVYLGPEGRNPSRSFFILLLLYFLALLSKEMAFTFPLVAAWADWSLKRRLQWGRYAVMLGVFGVYSILRISALGQFFVSRVAVGITPYARFLTTIGLAGDYLAKSFVPFEINPFHVFSPVTSAQSVDFLSGVLFLSLTGLLAWVFRKSRTAVFLLGFLVISIAPVLNITGAGENVFADRYLYIPTLASAILLPVFGFSVWSLLGQKWPVSGRSLGITGLGLAICGYGFVLANTMYLWRDDRTLYTEILRRSPTAMGIANNLGIYYLWHGDLARAREVLRRAVGMWDKSFIQNSMSLAQSYDGLGAVALKEGKYEEARENIYKAYQLAPQAFFTLRDLGTLHATLGEYDKASEWYKRALAVNPKDEIVYNNMGFVAVQQGRYDDAIECARKSLSIHPQFAEPYIILGRGFKGKGMIEEARNAYFTARKLDPSGPNRVDAELRRLDAETLKAK